MARLPEIAVTDTHALIWWLTDQRRLLGRRANAFFDAVDAGGAVVCIPTIVLVELAEVVTSGGIELGESLDRFVDRLALTPSRYLLVDLTLPIVRRSLDLFTIPERADRLIAATAAEMGYPLITRDPEIVRSGRVPHLWG